MGLMDKVKSLFTEEVEIEEEVPVVTKREKKVEVELPKKEEVKEELEVRETLSDTPVLSRAERPKTPVYFDDKAFEDLLAPKKEREEVKKPAKREIFRKPMEEVYKGNSKNEEAKVFKPSPIISPVYGVLDRNYKKDDIKSNELEKPTVAVKKSSEITVDDIRNKAFGTLEDDLENTFFTNNVEKYEPEENEDLDVFEEVETRESRNSKVDLLREDYKAEKEEHEEQDISKELEKQKQKINEINEYIKTKSSRNTEIENKEEEIEQTIEEPVVLEKEEQSNGVESELFDLIDSMYEKRDE